MNFLIGFFIYGLICFAILMTQFWGIPEEDLERVIAEYNKTHNDDFSKTTIFFSSLFFGWIVVPLSLFSKRGY